MLIEGVFVSFQTEILCYNRSINNFIFLFSLGLFQEYDAVLEIRRNTNV